MNLRLFRSSFERYKQKVAKVPLDDLTILWFDDFYDGMLSGMLEFEEQQYRFEIISDYQNQVRPRVFAIVRLSDAEKEKAIHWHMMFEKYVANDPISFEDATIWHRKSEHKQFYEDYPKSKAAYDVNEIVGWFMD